MSESDILNSAIRQALPIILPAVRQVFQEELASKLNADLQARYLSEREARQLFKPSPTRQTFINWEHRGLVTAYMIGGRKYYLFSELTAAVEKIKKYQRA